MLKLSDSASELLTDIRKEKDIPDHFGVRIPGEPTNEGGVQVEIGFVEEPVSEDQVADKEDTKLFVAPEVAKPLSDAVLDTEESPQGKRLVSKPASPDAE